MMNVNPIHMSATANQRLRTIQREAGFHEADHQRVKRAGLDLPHPQPRRIPPLITITFLAGRQVIDRRGSR
jgi:hypothetical protein